MGSPLLTKREAAQVLGCSIRTVFYKIQHGYLRPVANGRLVCVYEEDVIALRDMENNINIGREKALPVNATTLMRHETQIKMLRQELDQVLRVLNIRREPLKLSDLEIVSLYKVAQQYATEGWPPHIEETWASYFLRLQVCHFNQIETITKDEHPWLPFLRLVNTMTLRPYNTELTLQLASGRDHLQGMVTVWFELRRISPRKLDAMLNHEASPGKRLLGMLERRQAKFAAKD